MNNNFDKYKDIINITNYISKKYPRMSLEKRASQFAPFSALTGYKEAIYEQGKITFPKKELLDDLKEDINRKLNIILEKIVDKQEIYITYFKPDEKKEGGEYIRRKGIVKKFDLYNKYIFLDKTKIPIDEIIEIER